MKICVIFIVVQQLTAAFSQLQRCPIIRGTCDEGAAPVGAWRSKISSGRVMSKPGDKRASHSFTWVPDPAVPGRSNNYRIALREIGNRQSPFKITEPAQNPNRLTVNDLDFDTHYEAMVCYANVTINFLEMERGLSAPCGFCRTCLRTYPAPPNPTITTNPEEQEGGEDDPEEQEGGEDDSLPDSALFAIIALVPIIVVVILIVLSILMYRYCQRRREKKKKSKPNRNWSPGY